MYKAGQLVKWTIVMNKSLWLSSWTPISCLSSISRRAEGHETILLPTSFESADSTQALLC